MKWRLGDMPLTLFILLAAALAYLAMAGRRKAQQGASRDQGGASARPRVTFPAPDQEGLARRYTLPFKPFTIGPSPKPWVNEMRRERYGRESF